MRVLLGPDAIEFEGGRRHWICSVCGRTGRWSDAWSAYASGLDYDEAEIPFVVCSDACRDSDRGKLLQAYADSLGSRQMGTGRYPAQRVEAAQNALGLEVTA